jgi:hypothetical protein
MNNSWYCRVVRLLTGTVACIAVIGGAMGMSAAAHAMTSPPSPTPMCAVATR